MAALNSSTATDIVQLVDNHAPLIDSAVSDVEILSNGQLTLTYTDGSTAVNTIPYIADAVVSGITLDLLPPPTALTINYTSGQYQINAVLYNILVAGSLAIPIGAGLPRFDVVYLDTLNTINYLVGTPAASPSIPAPPVNTLIIGVVYVEGTASAATGGTYLNLFNYQNQVINSGNNLLNGTVNNSIIRWDSSLGRWIENPNITNETTKLYINGDASTATENLTVDGRVEILDTSAPGVVTNKLYAVAGILYWNGSVVGVGGGTVAPSTVVGSILKGDGLGGWIEDTEFLVSADDFKTDKPILFNATTATPGGTTNRLYTTGGDLYFSGNLVTPVPQTGAPGYIMAADGVGVWAANQAVQINPTNTSYIDFNNTGNISLVAGTSSITNYCDTLSSIINIQNIIAISGGDVSYQLTASGHFFELANSDIYRVLGTSAGFPVYLQIGGGVSTSGDPTLSTLLSSRSSVTAGGTNSAIIGGEGNTMAAVDNTVAIGLQNKSVNVSNRVYLHGQIIIVDGTGIIGNIDLQNGYNGVNLILDTTVGLKIGTGVTQKLAFYNKTPIVQQSAMTVANANAFATGPLTVGEVTTLNNMRTRINELEARLSSYGLLP